ncbi:MAG: S49 family peptidase [Desulfovibrionaceae bacterium]
MRARRAINLLAGQVWALEPEKLEAVAQLVEDLSLGRATNPEPFAAIAGEGPSVNRPYAVEDGVAIIPVDGVIAFRMNLFQAMSGGTSTEMLGKYVRMAASDSGVEAILLDVTSPGGAVHGLSDLSAEIRDAASVKPVVAWTGEQCCSAAYWIASAASEIGCSVSACVGSIGVYAIHVETSAKDAKDGVTRTIFKAGRYKAAGNPVEPLSDDSRAIIQQQVDQYYALFVDAVAENLSRSVDEVLSAMADGRTHIGQKALDMGFVNFIGDRAAAIARARALASTLNQEAIMPAGTTLPGGLGAQLESGSGAVTISALTAEQLKAECPSLVESLRAEGVQAERARVAEILEAGGDSPAALQAVKEGTEPAAFFKAALEAERSGRGSALKAMQESLSESVGQDGKAASSDKPADFMALVEEHRKATGCSGGDAVKAMGRKHPDIHSAWLASQERS